MMMSVRMIRGWRIRSHRQALSIEPCPRQPTWVICDGRRMWWSIP